MTTRLHLAPDALAAAVRTVDHRAVDPVALLVAIHEARNATELTAARLRAIRHIGTIGGPVWPGACQVETGPDALVLGCPVDREGSSAWTTRAGDGLGDELVADLDSGEPLDLYDPTGELVHIDHGPLTFVVRIAWVSNRTESRLARQAAAEQAGGRAS